MKTNDKKFYIYLPNQKEPVEVTEEVYRAYYQPIWRALDFAKNHGRCLLDGNLWYKCQGDCGNCTYQTSGDMVSLDEEFEGDSDNFTRKDTLKEEYIPFDEILADAELLEALFGVLEELTPEHQSICHCIMEGLSERTAAELLGMPRSNYRRRVQKLLVQLKKDLEK